MAVYNVDKDGKKVLFELGTVSVTVYELRSHSNNVLTTPTVIFNLMFFTPFKKLIEALGVTKVIITSAYRDSKCDKLVGGTGKGQHVEGNAIDCILYKGKSIIDTKLVSCIAQDVGFSGIARISDRAIHLDVRPEGRYYGDEMKGHTRSVTTDFYKYYNIERNNKDIDKVCKKFGLDKDFWNKNYNTDLGKENIIHLFEKISNKLN